MSPFNANWILLDLIFLMSRSESHNAHPHVLLRDFGLGWNPLWLPHCWVILLVRFISLQVPFPAMLVIESHNGLGWKWLQRSSSSNPTARGRDPQWLSCWSPWLCKQNSYPEFSIQIAAVRETVFLISFQSLHLLKIFGTEFFHFEIKVNFINAA